MRLHGRALPYALVALFAVGNGAAAHGADWPAAGERRTSFDARWRFQKGDPAGAEKAAFDDAGWRVLDLPHDWAIEGPFDPAISPHQGSLPFFGVAWYRKRFEVPESAREQALRARDRRGDVERDRLPERPRARRPAVRLHRLRGRPDAPPPLRRRERRGGPARARAGILALVPRRGALPPRLGRRHGPGARGAVGHLRDDAGRDARPGRRWRCAPSFATARAIPPASPSRR